MSAVLRLAPRGPFRLSESARFLHAWTRTPEEPGEPLRMAMVLDGYAGAARVGLREDGGGVLATVSGAPDAGRAGTQIARVMSLDHDASAYEGVGARDPVAGALMRRAPGLRPVLFTTPYEAAAWAVLSQRTGMAQARRMRAGLAEALGRPVDAAGRELRAFPLPADLLDAADLPAGIGEIRAERLRGLARAALEGRLDAGALRGAPPAEALAALRELPGIGPFSAELVLLRGCGPADVLALAEPRLRAIVGRAYGIGAADDAALEAIGERWRPFRTWVGVLFRAMGE